MKTSFFVLGLAAFASLAFAASPAAVVATPEPGTTLLMASGLAGVGFTIWHRNRKK